MKKDYKTVWTMCQEIIKNELCDNKDVFEDWVAPIIPLSLENNELTVQVPKYIFVHCTDNICAGVMGKAIKSTLGDDGILKYVFYDGEYVYTRTFDGKMTDLSCDKKLRPLTEMLSDCWRIKAENARLKEDLVVSLSNLEYDERENEELRRRCKELEIQNEGYKENFRDIKIKLDGVFCEQSVSNESVCHEWRTDFTNKNTLKVAVDMRGRWEKMYEELVNKGYIIGHCDEKGKKRWLGLIDGSTNIDGKIVWKTRWKLSYFIGSVVNWGKDCQDVDTDIWRFVIERFGLDKDNSSFKVEDLSTDWSKYKGRCSDMGLREIIEGGPRKVAR